MTEPEDWRSCLCCDDLVTKENVVEHLMESHDRLHVATTLALIMFLEDESDDIQESADG